MEEQSLLEATDIGPAVFVIRSATRSCFDVSRLFALAQNRFHEVTPHPSPSPSLALTLIRTLTLARTLTRTRTRTLTLALARTLTPTPTLSLALTLTLTRYRRDRPMAERTTRLQHLLSQFVHMRTCAKLVEAREVRDGFH